MSTTSPLLILARADDRPVTPDPAISYRPAFIPGRRYRITPTRPHPTTTPVAD